MCLTMSLCWCQTPHCSASHSLTHMHSAPVTHTFVLLAHTQTHLTFPPALPTLQILTDGDVESVNAEGGTPTLSKSMFFGVSFHRFGTLRSPLRLLICFTALVSCSVLFQLCLGNSPPGEKKKCNPLSPVSAERWWRTVKDSPLLVTDAELKNFSQVLFHACVFPMHISSLRLPVSHTSTSSFQLVSL